MKISENNQKLLNETVHVMKTKPEKDGSYVVFITSNQDGTDKGNVGELANMFGLSKDHAHKWSQTFEKPVAVQKLTSVPLPRKMYGWGYKVQPGENPLKVNKLIKSLFYLKDEYNRQKSYDLGVGVSSDSKEELIHKVETALSDAEMKADIPEVKANIEKYHNELLAMMKNTNLDEVFNYLADKIEQVESFQDNNETIFYRYSPANAFVIMTADPDAIVAAPESAWYKKGYIIKEKYRGTKGIPIAGGGSLSDAVAWIIKYHWDDVRRKFNLPYNADPKKVARERAYDIAAFGRNSGWKVPKDASGTSSIFSNNMVEPDPQQEYHAPIPDSISNEFRIEDPEVGTDEEKNTINVLYNGAMQFAKEELPSKSQVDLMGFPQTADGDINKLNKLIFRIASAEMVRKSYMEYKNLKNDAEKDEFLNKIKAYSEFVLGIIKKSFKLPASSSIYNVASHLGGLDDEQLQIGHDLIANTAGKIVHYLKQFAKNKQTESISEMRKMIRKTIVENLMKNYHAKK